MDEIRELLRKIQIVSEGPLESFIETLEKGSGKLREYLLLIREVSSKVKHLQDTEVKNLEDIQSRRSEEEQKFNSERVTHTTELHRLKKLVEDQEEVKASNDDQIRGQEMKIDGLTKLIDQKMTEYDRLTDKIEELKNPPRPFQANGNAHEERYNPKNHG